MCDVDLEGNAEAVEWHEDMCARAGVGLGFCVWSTGQCGDGFAATEGLMVSFGS